MDGDEMIDMAEGVRSAAEDAAKGGVTITASLKVKTEEAKLEFYVRAEPPKVEEPVYRFKYYDGPPLPFDWGVYNSMGTGPAPSEEEKAAMTKPVQTVPELLDEAGELLLLAVDVGADRDRILTGVAAILGYTGVVALD